MNQLKDRSLFTANNQKQKKKTAGHREKKSKANHFQGEDVVSFDIGQHTSKLIFGKILKSSEIEIKRAVTFQTPRGCVEKGRILNTERLAKEIRSIIKRERIRAKHAFCTVENAEIITREIVLPTTDEDMMSSMLSFEIPQYMPIELNDFIVQSKILEIFNKGETSMTRFLATAVPKDLAASYFELLQQAGLDAAVLDVHSNAVDKLGRSQFRVKNDGGQDEGAAAVIDFGYSHINVVLMEAGRYLFNRFIPDGGASIDRNLMSFFDYSEEDAEKEKISGIDLALVQTSPDNDEKQAENIVKNVIDNWITEFDRIFKFYATKSKGKTVQKMYIYGGTAKIKGFDAYLSDEFGIPVEPIESLAGIHIPDAKGMTIFPFVNAIGTLLRRQGNEYV